MVILGNGFDVALGIPTRYSNFYQNSAELRALADNGNALCRHILDHIHSDLWSDLESGLYHYSLGITEQYGEGDRDQAVKLRNEFNELRGALFNYLNSVSGNAVSVNDQSPVLGLNIEWHKLQPQYLTFNYSINTANTADMNSRYILHIDDSINELRFIYQHGSIYNMQGGRNNDPKEIVVGIDPATQIVEESHSFLYKSQQSLHNLESTIEFIQSKRFYIVYGCSVGDSDSTYFKLLFNHDQHDKIFLIYGFGKREINRIKGNIERICEININELSENNTVHFLDVTKVKKTRDDTRGIIESYIASLA